VKEAWKPVAAACGADAAPISSVAPRRTGVCCTVGTVGSAYPYIAFGAIGGQTPYTWTVASGQVPPGLSFSSGNPGTFINNVLSGTPTKAGTFAFTMK